ncbi:MAG: hypothetical protein L0216_02640 [Planctomycetales bacterium]|nr:hypothetical protein [Planctomycetales bacterium]
MDAAMSATPYRTYWSAWLVLLAITLAMVLTGSPPVLVAGMMAKATIIALWFMHLRTERLDLVLIVLGGIFATSLALFGLIAPDGWEMSS